MTGAEEHWEDVYGRKGADEVSWFQRSPELSLRLIDGLSLDRSARIIDVGGGASTLVDGLLDRGFEHVSVLDISAAGLELAKHRLGPRSDAVSWIVGDVTRADFGSSQFDVWHDRAVFHFLSDPAARAAYVERARRAIRLEGTAIVATFGLDGPERCSGLEVVRYDADGIHREFGEGFIKFGGAAETHRTPWGSEQEFMYCVCRRSDVLSGPDGG